MIEIVDLFGAFVRALFISSSLGAERANGVSITANQSFSSSYEVCEYAALWQFAKSPAGRRGRTPPPYDRTKEPAWHRHNNIANISRDLALSNRPQILAGIAVGRLSIEDAIEFRNYFAHRNEDTKSLAVTRLARQSIAPVQSIEESLLLRVPTRVYRVIDGLFDDVADMIDMMAR